MLKDLIERLKEATEPNTALDTAIGEVLKLEPEGGFWNSVKDDFVLIYPAYTNSLDAALTLVPEDFDWVVARTNGGLTVHACCGGTKEHFGDTPAIALCIAALTARLDA